MNRLWSRVSVRVTAVALLVLGIVGGVYLGQGRAVQERSAEASLVLQSDAAEMQLLKERQREHSATRAWQRAAEDDAAAQAAAEARAAADKARKLEKKAIDKKIAAEKAAEAKKKSESGSGSGAEVPYAGEIPESCDEFSGNRAIGCAEMLKAGFDIDQFPCLDRLWTRESHWRTKASNPSSGAYGIPQALPGSKMASKGDDWRTNPATQIKWGLSYIEGRYNTPCGAWNHSEDVGWY